MGTLYVDRKNLHVRLDGSALAFYANGMREGTVPINPLKRVIIVGAVTLDTAVLHKLSDENISVLFLSGRRARFRGMLHGRLHSNGLLRVKQYAKALSPSFALYTATEIVARKVSAQRGLLSEAVAARPELRFPLTSAVQTLGAIEATLRNTAPSIDSLRGLEGSAAAAYFSGYVTLFPESLNFHGRNRRPPRDPVNAMLSLCYTLLHYEIVREIEVIGLDPTIGFYHQFEYGRESLACDLVELFRSEVDRAIWALFRERAFTARDYSYEEERPGCYLKKEARSRFYPLHEEWAKRMRPVYTDEVRNLARRIMDGDDGQNSVSE